MAIRLRAFLFLVTLLIGAGAAAEQGRQVAITIDDVPRGGDGGPYDPAGMRAMTEKLLRPIGKHKIPVMGFVNAGRREGDPKELREILDLWLDAGADLGNHSFSHPDINNIPLSEYLADIVKGEPAIRDALAARGRKLEFYRHPFLHTGPTADIKQGLQAFLDRRGYRVAPVTLDNADYAFAMLYPKREFRDQVRREYVPYMESVVNFFEQRSVEVVGYEIPQILLIHANQLNADLMPELLDMFRRRGYTFVTLARALKDPAYNFPETYVGRGGVSWIHRWSTSKGMAAKGEPDPAEWVQKAISSTATGAQSQAEPVQRPPPAVYMGIELLKSNEQALFAKLSPTQATALFRDLNEVNEGYCYASSQGISVAFRRYATVYDTVELSRTAVGDKCKPVLIALDRCIGPLCLGASRDEVERQLGKQLVPAEDGEMAARYEYDVPMSAAELKHFAPFEITSIPVTHVIWLRFDEKGLNYIGVWRWEDLP